ncbi:hypothetical protein PR048_008118, partial [Dryococelus australis]
MGDEEVFGYMKNGNFMRCLELIAEYDYFLADHIARFGNPGEGFTSYLSPATYQGSIGLVGRTVSEKIDSEVISSKYFSVIVDFTPDISHNDQLSVIIRYVTEDGLSVEIFLSRAVQCCTTAIRFFELIQCLHDYFADSTGRWNTLETFFDSESMTVNNSMLDVNLRVFHDISVGCTLQQFGRVMKKPQAEDIDISTAVEMHDSLTMFLTELQTSFPIYKESAEKELVQIRNSESIPSSSAVEIQRPKRQIKLKRFFLKLSKIEEEPESPEEETESDCNEIWRKMKNHNRVNVYQDYNLRFLFLSNITELEPLKIYDDVEKLRAIYNSDKESKFGEECIHFQSYLLSIKKDDGDQLSSLPFLCRMLASGKLVMSTRMCTQHSRFKNYLRAARNQERLVNLGVLAIESDITVSLDFEEER